MNHPAKEIIKKPSWSVHNAVDAKISTEDWMIYWEERIWKHKSPSLKLHMLFGWN